MIVDEQELRELFEASPTPGRFVVTSFTSWSRSHRIVEASDELAST